jgi:hypothetical protein
MTLIFTLFRSEGTVISYEATVIDFEDKLPLVNANRGKYAFTMNR